MYAVRRSSGFAPSTTVLVAVLLLTALVVTATGCAGTKTTSTQSSRPMTQTSAKPGMPAQASSVATAQTCAVCGGRGPSPTTKGEQTSGQGVQVLRIGVKNGYYSPNTFVVKAGVPVSVVFTGSAKGCLAKPKFPKLDKQGDFTSGTATVHLGSLEPGEYAFTCGMGSGGGKITVQ